MVNLCGHSLWSTIVDHSCEQPLWTTHKTPDFAHHQLGVVEDSRSELSLVFIIELQIEFHEDASDIALRVELARDKKITIRWILQFTFRTTEPSAFIVVGLNVSFIVLGP